MQWNRIKPTSPAGARLAGAGLVTLGLLIAVGNIPRGARPAATPGVVPATPGEGKSLRRSRFRAERRPDPEVLLCQAVGVPPQSFPNEPAPQAYPDGLLPSPYGGAAPQPTPAMAPGLQPTPAVGPEEIVPAGPPPMAGDYMPPMYPGGPTSPPCSCGQRPDSYPRFQHPHADHPYRADGGFENPCGPQFQRYFQGEYVARPRLAHVPHYRLRPDDELDFIFRLTRDETTTPYQINVGDEVRIESFTDRNLDRNLIVQPDGTITLGLLGQVRATHHTVTQLRDELEERYKKFYKVPAITVTPIRVNTKLEDIRATVDSRAGFGGQTRHGRVTPEGTVGLPAIGSVPCQGLTLEELKREINERYDQEVQGLEVTPVLTLRAPRFVFVQGEVRNPGRYNMEGPTTVMQAITTAGGWNVGANIEQIVVFRRNEEWQLVATMLDLRQAFLGRRSAPAGEIWAADYDLIIVPKSKLLLFDNFAQLVFTNGIYRVVPFTTSINFTALSGYAVAAAGSSSVTP